MTEKKERGEGQREKRGMTEKEVFKKMCEAAKREDLVIDSIHTHYNEQGELAEYGTKTIWNETPDEDGVYHGVAFHFQYAAGKQHRRIFKDFNNIIFRVDWTGVKKGDLVEEDEEEGQEVIADW